MDDRQLEYFLAVADELSFTRAAQRTFAVQSTVSAGIRALERELGGALFDRTPQNVALTDLGRRLLPIVRTAHEALEAVRSEASPAQGIRGRLRVGIFTNLAFIDLPGLLGEFHTRHPLVDLQLGPSPSGSTGLADDVKQGRIDAAFMGLPEPLPGLRTLPVAKTRFVAVLPEEHPLAELEVVPIRDLLSERFVDARAGFGNRVTLDRALARLGLGRQVTTEVADLGEIPRFVAARLGIAIMPELTVIPAAGAVVRRIDEPIEWSLSLISRPGGEAAADAFVHLVAERVSTKVWKH